MHRPRSTVRFSNIIDRPARQTGPVRTRLNCTDTLHRTRDLLAKPLGLTTQEKVDLESFLRALTDKRFLATAKSTKIT